MKQQKKDQEPGFAPVGIPPNTVVIIVKRRHLKWLLVSALLVASGGGDTRGTPPPSWCEVPPEFRREIARVTEIRRSDTGTSHSHT